MTQAVLEKPAAAASTAFTSDTYIPASAWGKDHWSTLAYVESVMVECGGFQVGLDARMRMTRRHHRVMSEQCGRPKRVSQVSGSLILGSHPTRLRDGALVENHDDFHCLQDMAKEGLFDCSTGDVEPGTTLNLSKKGKAWADALREHKRNRGSFSTFNADELPALPECSVAPTEYFHWADLRFNVSAALADISTGKIRPKEDTLDREFIANYATKMLGIDKNERERDQIGTFFMSISSKHALDLPTDVLADPVIMMYAGKGKGVLNLGSGADYVMADGNHRMIRSYMDDLGDHPVLVLSPAQSRRYRS